MSSLLSRVSETLVKLESTYGTDSTPSASANAVVMEEATWAPVAEVIDPNPLRATLSRVAPIQGRKIGRFTCSVPIKGSGTAGAVPEWEPLLLACRFSQTIVGATSVTYKPSTGAFTGTDSTEKHGSCTIWHYMDGTLIKMNGCRGNVVFRFPAGERAMMDFDLMGALVDEADSAVPTVSNLDATIALPCKSMSFTINSYAGVISSLECDMGNNVQPSDSVNGSDGYGDVEIVARNPTGSMNPERTLIATHDWWSEWEDGTSMALTMALTGSAGNICTFTAPAVIDREITPGDRNGKAIYDIGISYSGSSGDDEVSLALT